MNDALPPHWRRGDHVLFTGPDSGRTVEAVIDSPLMTDPEAPGNQLVYEVTFLDGSGRHRVLADALSDLQRETQATRGDFDVHYDPETGTGSIQAEYGDRTDLGETSLMSVPQDFLNRVQLSGDEIVRIIFESGQERIIPASAFHQTVAASERVAFFETYSPQEWIAHGGQLPLTQQDETSERPNSPERNRLQELADRVRHWFQRDRDQGMGL
jgi:hypothetical protein